MALKSPTWFLHKAYQEEKSGSQLAQLSEKAMDLGLTGAHGTRSHVNQAVGAVQRFYQAHPQHVTTVQQAPPSAFKPSGQMLTDWTTFFTAANGTYGRAEYGYDFDTLKGIVTPKYGGTRTGGGGGNHELEIVFRLLADFI